MNSQLFGRHCCVRFAKESKWYIADNWKVSVMTKEASAESSSCGFNCSARCFHQLAAIHGPECGAICAAVVVVVVVVGVVSNNRQDSPWAPTSQPPPASSTNLYFSKPPFFIRMRSFLHYFINDHFQFVSCLYLVSIMISPFEKWFLAVHKQLNKWPSPLLAWSICLLPIKTKASTKLQSDPRDLWPLRHLITVMRRHDLTQKDLPTYIPTHLPTYLPDHSLSHFWFTVCSRIFSCYR